MIVEVDGFGNFDLPDVIESDTVVLRNYYAGVWHKIDLRTLEKKHPHVTWIVEDNLFHKQVGHRQKYHNNLPFYFLHHTVWHGINMIEGDVGHTLASDEKDFGPRHFCFLNNIPRAYRVKLWERLKSDGLLNEYCSLLHRGVSVGERNPSFDWNTHGHVFSMRPPTFYDSVVADLYCEAEVKGHVRFTEKTWKPLFYGKIPLGFGPQYYYKTLMDLGFQFPDILLDYTFDELEDTAERFEGFYEQVKRFASLPLPIDENITEHNRRRCFELVKDNDPPPDVLRVLYYKAEEYLKLGRIFPTEEERQEYWREKKQG